MERRRHLQGIELAHTLVDTLIDKKGSNILLLDITEQAVFTDYFILCTGDNKRLLNALTEDVVEAARNKAERRPRGTEGDPSEGWMLVDFGDVIVHLFTPDERSYYGLEELWSDSRVMIRIQ